MAATAPVDEVALRDLRVIQQCGVDVASRPILVIAASRMPDPKTVDYDQLLRFIIKQLDPYVESDYVVVLLYSGMKHKVSWSWLRQAYNLMDRKYKKNLKNLYVVHPSFWHKLLMSFAEWFISSKFMKKIVYVSRLEELTPHMRLEQLDIPEDVWKADGGFKSKDTAVAPRAPIGKATEAGEYGRTLQAALENGRLPLPLLLPVQQIRREGLQVEGIFRRSPSAAILLQIKERFHRGEAVDLSRVDVHVSAVLLKMYLRDLPTPLFSEENAAGFAAIRAALITCRSLTLIARVASPCRLVERLELPSDDQRIVALQQFITGLPAEHQVVLSYFTHLLNEVAALSSKNLMTPANLAIVFGPNVVPTTVVLTNMGAANAVLEMIITHHRRIWPDFSLEEIEGEQGARSVLSRTRSTAPVPSAALDVQRALPSLPPPAQVESIVVGQAAPVAAPATPSSSYAEVPARIALEEAAAADQSAAEKAAAEKAAVEEAARVAAEKAAAEEAARVAAAEEAARVAAEKAAAEEAASVAAEKAAAEEAARVAAEEAARVAAAEEAARVAAAEEAARVAAAEEAARVAAAEEAARVAAAEEAARVAAAAEKAAAEEAARVAAEEAARVAAAEEAARVAAEKAAAEEAARVAAAEEAARVAAAEEAARVAAENGAADVPQTSVSDQAASDEAARPPADPFDLLGATVSHSIPAAGTGALFDIGDVAGQPASTETSVASTTADLLLGDFLGEAKPARTSNPPAPAAAGSLLDDFFGDIAPAVPATTSTGSAVVGNLLD